MAAEADGQGDQRWQGGKLPGGVYPYKDKKDCVRGWRFRVVGKEAEGLPMEMRSKFFSFKEYRNSDEAKAAAEAHRRRVVADHGLLIKNQYRYRTDPVHGVFLEVHSKGPEGADYYWQMDFEDLPRLESNIWSIGLRGGNAYVAKTTTLFHIEKCREMGWKVVDHINRNGLDNRWVNLRDGGGGVNQSNCKLRVDSMSGVTGVKYDDKRKAWVTRFGKKTGPSFPGPKDKDHPSFLEACACRAAWAATVGNTNGQ